MQRKNAAVWGISSAGRASALHAEGQRFDPAMLHHLEINLEKSRFLFYKKKGINSELIVSRYDKK